MIEISKSVIIGICSLSIFIVLRLALQRTIRSHTIRQQNCEPATHYKHKDPFFGLDLWWKHLRAFKQSQFTALSQQQHCDHGPTFQYTAFGGEVINSIDPANFKSVMSRNFENWGVQPIRLLAAEPFLGYGLFTTDGPLWHLGRSQVKPVLIAQFSDFGALESHLQKFLDLIPDDGIAFDILPLLDSLMTDIGTEFLFGQSVNSLTRESSINTKEFVQALEVAKTEVNRRHLLGRLVKLLPRNREFDRACLLIHKVIGQRIDEAFEYVCSPKSKMNDENNERPILVHELAKLTDDKALIRSNLITAFAGGAESQAVAVSNVFFVLSRHSDVLKKLREEVLKLGPGIPNLEILRGMPYLKSVINEVLRLYPIASFLYRTALNDTTLPTGGGADGKSPVFVRKGTTFVLSFYALHRDKSQWGQDAEEFNPERWNTPLPNLSDRFQPFGSGRRTCPGQALALAEVSYVVVRLLQEFADVQSGDEREWMENLKMVLANRNGVRIALKRK